MENPKKQIEHEIRLWKDLNEKQRKLKDIQLEDEVGKRNLRYISEDLYAPIIEATKAASSDSVKKMDELALITAKTNNEIEDYKTGTKELVKVLENAKQTIQLELEADRKRKVATERYGAIPDDVLVFLANKSDDALCIQFDEELDPPSLVLGGNPVQQFHSNYITVKNVRYRMTPGVWQLLTRKGQAAVEGITEEDKELYSRLMWGTKHTRTINSYGQPVSKSSKSAKWAILKEFGMKHGYYHEVKPRTLSRTSTESETGEGLESKQIIKYIPNDLNFLVNKLYTTILNIEAGHTNINQDDIHLASEILDMLYKENHLSQTAFKNIYQLFGTK